MKNNVNNGFELSRDAPKSDLNRFLGRDEMIHLRKLMKGDEPAQVQERTQDERETGNVVIDSVQQYSAENILKTLQTKIIDQLESNIPTSDTQRDDFPVRAHIDFFQQTLKEVYGDFDPFDRNSPAYLLKPENRSVLELFFSKGRLMCLLLYTVVEKSKIDLLKDMIRSPWFDPCKELYLYPMVVRVAEDSNNPLLKAVGTLCDKVDQFFEGSLVKVKKRIDIFPVFFLRCLRFFKNAELSFEAIHSNPIAREVFASIPQLAFCLELDEKLRAQAQNDRSVIQQPRTSVAGISQDGAVKIFDHGLCADERRGQLFEDPQQNTPENSELMSKFYLFKIRLQRGLERANRDPALLGTSNFINGLLRLLDDQEEGFKLYCRVYEYFEAQQSLPSSQPPPAAPRC